MALDYTGSATLMNDPVFRGRVKVAVLKYAGYITGEDPGVPAHNSRLKWAQNALTQPDFVAGQVTPIVVGDPGIQAANQPDASDVTDSTVQSATEGAINKIL
jgi:hypothetical protein